MKKPAFTNTLNFGVQRIDEILKRVHKENLEHIPGDEIFKLHDTFGFPVDLTARICKR